MGVTGPVSVRVLGTAQDGGIPQAGCTCPRCEGARRDPRRRRLVSSLGIVDGKAGLAWLVDATPDLPEQIDRLRRACPGLRSVRRRPVEGILLTHAHAGHIAGLLPFGREAMAADAVAVHGTPRMLRFLRENAPWRLLLEERHLVPRTLRAGWSVRLGERITVVAHAVPHRAEWTDTVGFEIRGPRRSLLYVPDIDRWEGWSGFRRTVGRVDYALLDGTFSDPAELPDRAIGEIPHPLIPHTRTLLGAEARGKVWFTHLNHTNAAADGRGVAREGQRFSL